MEKIAVAEGAMNDEAVERAWDEARKVLSETDEAARRRQARFAARAGQPGLGACSAPRVCFRGRRFQLLFQVNPN